ncbi:MAG TPA: MFS transporter [Epsilonproteobacteria bacterium]|nr:MFS transporter [Campylobacterota bacterium]
MTITTNKFIIASVLASYYFFYFALVGVYIVFLPKILIDLGYSPFEVGIIYAAAPFMRFIVPFLFRYGLVLHYKNYLYSLLLTVGATIIFWFTIDSFWSYLLANLLFGATMGISLPYVETIALSHLSKSHYGKIRLWGSIGFMVIVLWLGKTLKEPNSGLIALVVIASLTLIFGAIAGRFDTSLKNQIEDSSTFYLRTYMWFWLSLLLMQMSFGGFYNFFTIYQESHGVSLEIISWMWSFGVICEILMLYFQGPLLQRNLLKIIQFATLITALRWFILYLFAGEVGFVFFAQSLHAISFALYHTAAISYLLLLYAQKKLAQQFFLGIAFGLGGSLGAIVAGKLYGDNLFLWQGIIALFSLLALVLSEKKEGNRG